MTLGSHVNFPEAVKNRQGQLYRQRVNVYYYLAPHLLKLFVKWLIQSTTFYERTVLQIIDRAIHTAHKYNFNI